MSCFTLLCTSVFLHLPLWISVWIIVCSNGRYVSRPMCLCIYCWDMKVINQSYLPSHSKFSLIIINGYICSRRAVDMVLETTTQTKTKKSLYVSLALYFRVFFIILNETLPHTHLRNIRLVSLEKIHLRYCRLNNLSFVLFSSAFTSR